MPVRTIKKIITSSENDRSMIIRIPDAILDCFNVSSDDVFVCEFKRHFDKDKNLICEINETIKWQPFSIRYRELSLVEKPIAKKYGFVFGEYIEVIFQAIEEMRVTTEGTIFRRKKRGIETTQIFPERMLEDLEFIPGEGGK